MVVSTPRGVIYLSIEYCRADLFSGNGVCARSQVRALAAQGVNVLVICGRPADAAEPEPAQPRVKVLSVPLDVWFTTDRTSSHAQFAQGAARLLHDHVRVVDYDAILAVDWTGMNAIRRYAASGAKVNRIVMYLNFRVYCSMAAISQADRAFYNEEERAAVRFAIDHGGGVAALCNADESSLRLLDDRDSPPPPALDGPRFQVILPMLRDEFSCIARADEDEILDFDRERMYLVSLVRLSEDKGAHRFVKLLQRLQELDPDIWKRTGVVPLMCGADSQPEYARNLKSELKATVPNAVIMDKFLTPTELSVILKNSVLNIHPAEYEAYGLTIVEAASMGCPTVLNESGIGAAQLLSPTRKASAAVEITDERALADTVRRLLEDGVHRQQLAHSAYLHATSWTETEHVRALMEFTSERVMRKLSDQNPKK